MKMESESEINNYFDGFLDGLREFAWWKDGVQYVGTNKKTLKEVSESAEILRSKSLEKVRARKVGNAGTYQLLDGI